MNTTGMPVYIVNAAHNAARGIVKSDGTVHSGGNDGVIAYVVIDTNGSDWFINTRRIEVPMSAVIRRQGWKPLRYRYAENPSGNEYHGRPDTRPAIGVIPLGVITETLPVRSVRAQIAYLD